MAIPTIYPYRPSPHWPLIASILFHVGLVSLLFFYQGHTTDVAEKTSQSVELWAPLEEIEQIAQASPSNPLTPNVGQPMPPIKGDIALPTPRLAQHHIAHSSQVQPKSSIPLPNAHRTVEKALSTLTTQSSKPATQSVTMSTAPDMSAYTIQVIRRIRPHIRIPPSLVGNPTAKVQVRLALGSMEIIFAKLIQSSGNVEYDQSILQAVQKVGQLPPLPTHTNPNMWRSITLIFRPHE